MQLAWPFKARAGNGRDEEEDRSPTGDAWPDFLCVGAQKAGTSWLYRQCEPHGDFWMPPLKELHYFNKLTKAKRENSPRCRDERDACFLDSVSRLSTRPYIDMENYARLFAYKGSRLSGDITPTYSMLNDEIIERIVSHFPNLKVIFLARDPVQRAWSQLSMGVSLGRISRFDATDVDAVIRGLLHPHVLSLSYPSKIVARWRRHVPPDLFRLYFFDDLERSPAELRRVIFHFLGADPDKPSGRIRPDDNRDAGRQKLRLTDRVRSRLAHFFKDELLACARELGGPASQWPARYGFSLLWLFIELADDIDLFFWWDWLA
jgi:sulfotransferase family protein